MKRILSVPLLVIFCCLSQLMGQVRKPQTATQSAAKPAAKPPVSKLPSGKKYPSLLWEISGNGLKKPSYLFGTMHVSNKLAFNLGDSFYNAIRSVNVVALETNPETWQDDYTLSMKMRRKGQRESRWSSAYDRDWSLPTQTMNISSFAIDSYEELAKASLALEPSMINGLLYRSYGGNSNDFEENTFLDMHIFQVGRKLGKRISGVEDFEESEKIVAEAYRDAEKDKNRKKKSYDYQVINTNPKKVEDAYRNGDLDLLDSLQALNVQSDAFQEKFLYKRNEIQARSIDSILHTASLFVGVGAAHLPGKRGVIEMLRDMGYTLRPVIMGNRSSHQKEALEKIRVEHAFHLQTADDGVYKVAIPGKKFYQFTNIGGFDVVQYADLVNGAYYLVTRIKTNGTIWGDDPSTVAGKIESALYENIPGKILKKTAITKNGYPGFDILNRTRRGDTQRYQVFFTPFEMIFFKMSGNGDFVSTGTEAARFFNSIVLKENTQTEWMNWQPATGGFSVLMPHTPGILRDNLWSNSRIEYGAVDKKEGNSYLIIKTNLHNYAHFEADSFELNLMDESYQYSEFISKRTSKTFSSPNGYPALTCEYLHKDGSFSSARFLIQGYNYYTVLARYKKQSPSVKNFLNSFTIRPHSYPEPVLQKDTVMKFTVNSPVPLSTMEPKEAAMFRFLQELRKGEEDGTDNEDTSDKTLFIGNDTTGEKIWISCSVYPNRVYNKDSLGFWKNMFGNEWNEDSSLVLSPVESRALSDGSRCIDFSVSDTGSSKLLLNRLLYKNGYLVSFSSLTDTVTRKTPLLENFYRSFSLLSDLKPIASINRKAADQVQDLFSKDSLVARKAAKEYRKIWFDSTDIPLLKNAIGSLNWGIRNYMATKRQFIKSLGEFKDPALVVWLKGLYMGVKDTSDLQQAILETLLEQRTKESFLAFKDLILQEPPLLEDYSDDGPAYEVIETPVYENVAGYRYSKRSYPDSKWSGLYDSLDLARLLLPDMLEFLNIDDYKNETLNLLYVLADSACISSTDYESWLNKLYLDGKMMLKKQLAGEHSRVMNKLAEKDRRNLFNSTAYDDDEEDEELMNEGNSKLHRYSVLLLPFRNKHQGVQNYFTQLMTTQDDRLLYNSFTLLLRNGQPVPDSLFSKFASADRYRAELYRDLKEMGKLQLFPVAEKDKQLIVRSLLLDELGHGNKPDSLQFLEALPVNYKGKDGLVYFYKYKKMRDDDSWSLAIAGLQPNAKDEVNVGRFDPFMQVDDRMLENDQPVDEQLKKVLHELLITCHPNAEEFYEPRKYSKYKSMFSEMIKDRRYRD